jgi:hypothetical protein
MKLRIRFWEEWSKSPGLLPWSYTMRVQLRRGSKALTRAASLRVVDPVQLLWELALEADVNPYKVTKAYMDARDDARADHVEYGTHRPWWLGSGGGRWEKGKRRLHSIEVDET